jgi:primosomal protein N''
MTARAALLLPLWFAACASGPVLPAWQADAKAAMERSTSAYLAGETKASDAEMALARRALTSTGRTELLARAELMRCAARVASLVFEPCERFEALRADAPASERVYADYLAARALSRDDIARLPTAQQAAATAVAGGELTPANVQSIEDPQARLIAVAVLFQAGKASPPMIDAAAETASAQGWRRPLLAWLKVQALRAEKAGDVAEAQRLQRRIAVVEGAASKP